MGKQAPNVIRCGDHQLAPYHIVCVHVVDGPAAAEDWVAVTLAEDDLREVEADYLCRACNQAMAGGTKPNLDLLRLVCMHCMNGRKKEVGYVPKCNGPT